MRKVFQPLAGLLREGMTPQELAMALAFGLTIGMIPCPWGATVLCVIIAFFLRLNHVAIQVANYLAWPLQIALLAPFFWLGQQFFPVGKPFVFENLTFSSFQQPLDSLQLLLFADAKAIGAWLLLSPLIFFLVYFPSKAVFSRFRKSLPQPPGIPSAAPDLVN